MRLSVVVLITIAETHISDSLANDGTKLYIRTNEDAPQYKVYTLDLADEMRECIDIIPEDKDAHLDDIIAVNGDTFAVVYKRNVSCPTFQSRTEICDLNNIHGHRLQTRCTFTHSQANVLPVLLRTSSVQHRCLDVETVMISS